MPHFVPTSSSWLNLIERWFGELTTKRVRRGSFHSVEELEKAITEFLAAWNRTSQTFCLDRHRGIDQSETRPLPADSGTNSTRLYAASQQKEAEKLSS